MADENLRRVAELLTQRNQIDEQIAAITHRPMASGHLGEWIAAQIFDIALEESASATAIDGHFRSGPLQRRTVNVKWFLQREGMLDMTTSDALDEYLVLTGPLSTALSFRGRTRPWRIDGVYLFDARALRADLQVRGVHIGTASSVRTELWTQAEIYPRPVNPRLPVTDRQIEALRLFRAD